MHRTCDHHEPTVVEARVSNSYQRYQYQTSVNATLATPAVQREEHTVTKATSGATKQRMERIAALVCSSVLGSALYALWQLFEKLDINENISKECRQGMSVFSSVDV